MVVDGKTFSNAAHRDAFAAEPTHHLPQYSGLCAFAMARGTEVGGDPGNYHVSGGRLFFNLSLSVQAKWERDAAENIRRADAQWRLLSREA